MAGQTDEMAAPAEESESPLREVAGMAFKLGWVAFGGPAAHIAMLRDQVVVRRRWMTEEHFLDLIGMTNLVPGPNSTEMVIHTGYERAGWRGLIVAGALFILPAAFLVLVLAWLYVQYGTTTAGDWLLYGIKPVIIAVVAQALWGLGQKALKGVLMGVIGAAVIGLYFLGVNELVLLFGGAIIGALAINWRRLTPGATALSAILPLGWLKFPAILAATATMVEPYSVTRLFLTFLKIGAVLYGSGYVLLAFVQDDFVNDLGWITQQQLIDAVAIGQFTPGPVFTTATFIGYVTGGFTGAVVATLGIFIPAFIFVALIRPLITRVRNSVWTGAMLDGVNASALGLMAAVTFQLGRAALIDPFTILLAVAAAVLLIRFKVSSVWLIIGGAIAGVAFQWLF